MIRLKDNTVKVENLVNELKCKLINLANICKSIEGEQYTMTITSAKDGKHMKDSKHYSGEAIDIRKFDMKNVKVVVEEIKDYLGKDFDVVEEKTHIHIELDRKGGGKK
jgi:hypothetical protein